jgi:hypothetical protein
MELEFDKEIDAILRKARSGTSASAATASAHIDADVIAAFAENALPDKARMVYTEHFADCGRCRKQLSQAILMSNTADATAADAVSAATVAAVPWYSGLFRTPNLAMAMGALVLVFSGVMGYLVLQNREGASNQTVSQMAEPQPTLGGPYFSGEADTANAANSNAVPNVAPAANTSSNSATAANTAASVPGTMANSAFRTETDSVTAGEDKPADEKQAAAAKSVAGGYAQPAAAPPASVTIDGTMTRDQAKTDAGAGRRADADKLKEENKDLELAKKSASDDRRMAREAAPAPSKVGPARSGPVQSQNSQLNSNVFDMAVTRIAGGKTFNNRDGAWYDTAYRGQATTNVRRGTDEYKKLDGGLRSIAATLGGVVVAVWKGKAYRIQ